MKGGDGLADLKPIAHLYKTQVYQLAEYLEVPEVIRKREPTTDTYSLQQSQEEFFFELPYQKMDLCLYGRNHGVSPADVGAAIGVTSEQVERVYRDIRSEAPNDGVLARETAPVGARHRSGQLMRSIPGLAPGGTIWSLIASTSSIRLLIC